MILKKALMLHKKMRLKRECYSFDDENSVQNEGL